MDNFLKETPDFDDILFEHRNKEYGAYFLRKRYNRVVLGSLIIAIIIGGAAVLIPFYRIPVKPTKTTYNIKYVTIENMMAPVDQLVIPAVPSTTAPPPSQTENIVKYIAPVVEDTIMPFETSKLPVTDLVPIGVPQHGIVGGRGNEIGLLSEVGGGGTNEPFMLVEVMPTFRGGDLNAFREWVIKRTVYPQQASDNGIEGIVFVTFIVEADGSVTNVKVTQGVDPLLDNEAIRVVSSSPKWLPGRQRGETVRVRFSIRLNFQN